MDQTLEEVSRPYLLYKLTNNLQFQTTFCIPYSGKDDNEIRLPNTHSVLEDNNHSDGSRLKAYKQAWDKCLERIQVRLHGDRGRPSPLTSPRPPFKGF